jgi:hypothetical protein
MAVSVCPMDVVEVPVDRVWAILMDSTRYAEWSDLGDFKEIRITPPGATMTGQVLEGKTSQLGITIRVRLAVREVNADEHRVGIDVSLPLGINNAASITATPLDEHTTRVAYG